jgi:uncharacterized membrane protein YraQ (UPF0718 family)
MGAIASFLIATPQSGIDSILATFSLMGLGFAIIRPTAALITGICGGLLVNRFVKDTQHPHHQRPRHRSVRPCSSRVRRLHVQRKSIISLHDKIIPPFFLHSLLQNLVVSEILFNFVPKRTKINTTKT